MPDGYEQFLSTVQDLSGAQPEEDQEARQLAQGVARALSQVDPLDRATLSKLAEDHPEWVPLLATVVGLSQEQLKNKLAFWFHTQSWNLVARRQPGALIEHLDSELGLVHRLDIQRRHVWTFADILLERYTWSRGRASRSISRGRRVEDETEKVIRDLGLVPSMRGRFVGRNGETAPCDFAIYPPGTETAVIVGCAKGFNSTGSKLTDAVREVVQMADVRLAHQWVFAVVDGIGWLSRRADLRRIYDLRARGRIDGLYTLQQKDDFRRDLAEFARLKGLIHG